MPIIKSVTKPTDPVYDAWGNIIRMDWTPVPGKTYEPGQAQEWQISGETNAPGAGYVSPGDPSLMAGYTGGSVLLQQALADPAFRSGQRSYLSSGGIGAQSMNAYRASLAAQGIPYDELPYNSGQEATIRAQGRRGIPLAPYLQSFLKGLADTGYFTSNPQDELAQFWRNPSGMSRNQSL